MSYCKPDCMPSLGMFRGAIKFALYLTIFFLATMSSLQTAWAAPATAPSGHPLGQSTTASCSGTVYRDDNANGSDDDGIALNAISMALYDDATGTLLGTAITDANGAWSIAELPLFTDVVVVVLGKSSLLKDAPFGADHTGLVQYVNTGSCSDLSTGLLLVSACTNLPLELGTFVWLDENADGIQNGNEAGLVGVTVNLYEDGTTNLVATTLTDAAGSFLFTSDDGIEPNTAYDIRLDNPADVGQGGSLVDADDDPYSLTLANQGISEERDSDAAMSSDSAHIDITTGSLGTSHHFYGFGFVPPASIGDLIWVDMNGNGVRDSYTTGYSDNLLQLRGYDFSSLLSVTQTAKLEDGIADVTVELYSAGSDSILNSPDDLLVNSTTTDANGNYLFRPVDPLIQYRVQVVTSTLPVGAVQTYDESTGLGDNMSFAPTIGTISAGQQYRTADFGYTYAVDLAVEKTASSSYFTADPTISFTINVTNNGTIAAPDVAVTDSLFNAVPGTDIVDYNVLFGRIWELWFTPTSMGQIQTNNGDYATYYADYPITPYTTTVSMEQVAEDWLRSNVTISGSGWSCQFDPDVQARFDISTYAQFLSDYQAYRDPLWDEWPLGVTVDLYWACELTTGDLAPGAGASPITVVVSNEFNMFMHEFEYPEYLSEWDGLLLYNVSGQSFGYPELDVGSTPEYSWNRLDEWAYIHHNGITNTVVVESAFGEEPSLLYADNSDDVAITLQGDLALEKTIDSPGPFRSGDIVTFSITVTNVGLVPWYSDIHILDHNAYDGSMEVISSTLPTAGGGWSCFVDNTIDGDFIRAEFINEDNRTVRNNMRAHACYHAPVVGGFMPGDSLTYTYQGVIGDREMGFNEYRKFGNVAQLWGVSANDQDENNNYAVAIDSFDGLGFSFTKSFTETSPTELTWAIGMDGMLVSDLRSGQSVFVEEYLNASTPLLSVASNGWQCEDAISYTSAQGNWHMCWFDPIANGLASSDPIPDLIITVEKPIAWTGDNRICATVGYYYGFQNHHLGTIEYASNTSVNAQGPCELTTYGASGPGGTSPVDFTIDKSHDPASDPWAVGSSQVFTLTIDELGVGSDVPIVEDILNPGATLVEIRNSAGQQIMDGAGTAGPAVDWACTLDVAGGLGTLTPQEFSCTRSTAMLTGTQDILAVEVLVGADVGSEVYNFALVYGQTRPEQTKPSAVTPPECWADDTATTNGLVDNCDIDRAPISSVDFEISKTHDESITYLPGQPVTHTIVITNNIDFSALPPTALVPSPQNATLPITVTDDLPSSAEFVSYSGTGWSCTSDGINGGLTSCTYDEVDHELAMGEATEPLTFVWKRTSGSASSSNPNYWPKNSVEVVGSDRTILYSETPDSVEDPVPFKAIYPRVVKSSSASQVIAGTGFDFYLDFDSVSSSSTSYVPIPAPVRITDSVPTAFTVDVGQIVAPEWDCSASNGQDVDCTYTGGGVLPIDYPLTTTNSVITIPVTVDHDVAPGDYSNTAYYDLGSYIPRSSSYIQSSKEVQVIEQVDLDISKSRDISEPEADNILDYTVVITNSGPSSADNVVVTDILPYGSSYVNNAGSDPAWSCSGDGNNPETVTCSLTGTVPGAASGVSGNAPALHVHVQLTQDALPGILNFITVDTSSATVSVPTGSLSATDEVILTTGCIGDYVWWDTLGDGVQEGVTAGVDGLFHTLDDVFGQPGPGADELLGTADDGQQGFQDVLMTLTDSNGGVITTTTDTAGYYSFGFLLEGSYTVTVDNNSGFLTYDNSPLSEFGPTYDLDSGTTNPDLVSRVSITDTGDITDLIALDVDFGFERLLGVSIGNRVWHDIDDDGSLDGTESGIDGVTVQLLNDSGIVISTTTTTGGGFYTFTVDLNGDLLPEGDYRVRIPSSNFGTGQPLENYRSSSVDGGDPDNNRDSDDNGPGSTTGSDVTSDLVTVELESEPTTDGDDNNGNLTVDFGFFEPVTVGNRVWYDLDNNGEQDAGESGVPGVDVTLYNAATNTVVTVDADGNAVAALTTNGTGHYTFTNLPLGNYYVVFDTADIPTGYEVTTQSASGVTDANDSDADPTTGQTDSTGLLSSGEENLDLDMGIWAPSSIGDTIWFDNDHDGIYEPSENENGVSGMDVTLYMSGNATPVMTTTTNLNGQYLFTNLVPGDYYVDFDLSDLPTGYTVTREDVATDPTDEADSDTDPNTGETHVVTLGPGESDLSLDMGIYAKVSVGNRVWYDDDYDGMQDSSENGVSDIDVTLYDATTNAIVTQDADGNAIRATDNRWQWLLSL